MQVMYPNCAGLDVILVAAYHMLRTAEPSHELGPDHLASRNPDRTKRRLIRRLEGLGFKVTLQPLAQTA